MGSESFLSRMEAKMPPGFRFHPRDEELVVDYLARRIANAHCQMMIDVDLNKVEPWDLPGEACVGGKEWYFYSLRDRKYATGQRTNRATVSGYWKATGKDRPVVDSRRGSRNVGGAGGSNSDGDDGVLVGMRKTLVFYKGRAPKGKKTDWVMHEFRLEPPLLNHPYSSSSSSMKEERQPSSSSSSKEDWVLCRVFYKKGNHSLKATTAATTTTTATTTTGDNNNNCYDDTAGSSTALMDITFMNMDQQPQQTPQFNLQVYNNEHVPCFSNSLLHPQPPPDRRSFPAFPPLVMSYTELVNLSSYTPYLSPISTESKPLFGPLQPLHKVVVAGESGLAVSGTAVEEGSGRDPSINAGQTAVQSMWNSCT